MSQTIIVNSDEGQLRLYSINLNMYVGTDTIQKRSPHEAIELLKVHPAIDLIVTKNIIEGENAGKIIEDYLIEEDRNIPLIVIGPDDNLSEIPIQLPENPDLKEVIQNAAKALGVTAKSMMEKIVPEYFPISINYFLSMDQANCDVFLRVKRDAGREFQYIKRIHKGDTFTKEDIGKYIEKGEKNLYIPKDFRLSFVNQYSEQMVGRLNSADLSNEDRMQANENAMSMAQENILNFGVSQETAELTKASIKSIMVTVKDNPKLSKLLGGLLSNQNSYMYQHCQLITFITQHIISGMDWGTEEQKEKLGFVAFFHDIVLTEDRFAKIRTKQQLKEAKLSKEEENIINRHPLSAAELLQNFPSAPIGVDIIIKQHHGQISGHGFPDFYSGQLAPLSMVFVVAEETTDKIINDFNDKKEFDHEDLMMHLQNRFNTAKWKKMIQTMESISF